MLVALRLAIYQADYAKVKSLLSTTSLHPLINEQYPELAGFTRGLAPFVQQGLLINLTVNFQDGYRTFVDDIVNVISLLAQDSREARQVVNPCAHMDKLVAILATFLSVGAKITPHAAHMLHRLHRENPTPMFEPQLFKLTELFLKGGYNINTVVANFEGINCTLLGLIMHLDRYSTDYMALFIQYGLSLDKPISTRIMAPLVAALIARDECAVRLLLDKGAKVEQILARRQIYIVLNHYKFDILKFHRAEDYMNMGFRVADGSKYEPSLNNCGKDAEDRVASLISAEQRLKKSELSYPSLFDRLAATFETFSARGYKTNLAEVVQHELHPTLIPAFNIRFKHKLDDFEQSLIAKARLSQSEKDSHIDQLGRMAYVNSIQERLALLQGRQPDLVKMNSFTYGYQCYKAKISDMVSLFALEIVARLKRIKK